MASPPKSGRPRESGDPAELEMSLIPACAGMTHASSRRSRLPLQAELDHPPRHGFGLLHMREMARFCDLLEFSAGARGAVAPAVRGRSEAVLRTPQKQRRNPDAVQARAQLRVVHVGVPGEVRG